MKTPKCPICGAPLKAIRGYDVQGITTAWVPGCYNCFFQSSRFWKTKKACIEDMDRLVSLFPPFMRVWPGDKGNSTKTGILKRLLERTQTGEFFIWKWLPGRLNPCGRTMWSCGRGRLRRLRLINIGNLDRLRRSTKVVIIVNTVPVLSISLLVSNA